MDLIAFAYQNGLSASRRLTRDEQKSLGQFMTPPAIARLMAARTCSGFEQSIVRVLDPSAGSGVLAAAICEELLRSPAVASRIEFVLCEYDPRLKASLNSLARKMRAAGEKVRAEISVSIVIGDFLLSPLACNRPQFDIVIANPPYFKLAKSDPRSVKHDYAVYGQPNIYGLFMAASSRLINEGGKWCFITPRSWTNGSYFANTRRQIRFHLHIDAMHVFESRQNHFTDDEVLQEAMITWATAQSGKQESIIVSTSQGVRDLDRARLRKLPAQDVIGVDTRSVIQLPSHDKALSRPFTATLETYGMKVSTGPVVAFRAGDFIVQSQTTSTVPLLWMQHIQHMRVSWPIRKKREHIRANGNSAWMLVPNVNMVVMRRFSPKEDPRRVTAAPYLAGGLPGDVLGLENHTNYIYRPGIGLTADETRGLAAYLNSRFVDHHLRMVAGNTQVNAADLRTLPLPPIETITNIGSELTAGATLADADSVVEEALLVAPVVHMKHG